MLLGLQVPVNDVLAMGEAHRAGNLNHDVERPAQIQRPERNVVADVRPRMRSITM